MRLQYCSDLHLEFERNRKWIAKYPLKVVGDVLLLGGDIMLLSQITQHADFLDYVADNFATTYWIPGNHEYYRGDIERGIDLNEAVRPNVFLVNNRCVSVGDVDIICSTLWSHIGPTHEWDITRAMSDFHQIKDGCGSLSVASYNHQHEAAKQFIEQAVGRSNAKHKVVLTHHVPTFMNYPEQYKGDALNEAFASEMHDFIAASGVDCWIYGHTHSNTPDFKIGNTHLLTNQLGYVEYGENKHFNNGKTFVTSG